VAGGTRCSYAHDGSGGPTATTDEAGAPLASLFYDAWGNLRSSRGDVERRQLPVHGGGTGSGDRPLPFA